MPLTDCFGVNCPLGIAHPPPDNDPRKGGVFPLGCGICRSEKLDVLKNVNLQQVFGVANRPKAQVAAGPQIVRPIRELEIPDFIAKADEILEEEQRLEAIEAELKAERLRKLPIYYLPPNKLKLARRKAERKAAARLLNLHQEEEIKEAEAADDE